MQWRKRQRRQQLAAAWHQRRRSQPDTADQVVCAHTDPASPALNEWTEHVPNSSPHLNGIVAKLVSGHPLAIVLHRQHMRRLHQPLMPAAAQRDADAVTVAAQAVGHLWHTAAVAKEAGGLGWAQRCQPPQVQRCNMNASQRLGWHPGDAVL